MNLYTVGCSFTHGHRSEEYEQNTQYLDDILINDYDKWAPAWPWLLQGNFEQVINDGLCGTGINYATRRLCRFLDIVDHRELDNWLFVIQISQAQRMEFLNQRTGLFYRVETPDIENRSTGWQGDINDRDHMSQFVHYIDVSNELQESFWIPEEIHKRYYAVKYFVHSVDHEQIYYEHTQRLMCLLNILESLNLKYLITGMFLRDYHPDHLGEYATSTYTRRLAKYISSHNMITDHVDILAEQDAEDPCGHPNKQGHQIIASSIIDQAKLRGWM